MAELDAATRARLRKACEEAVALAQLAGDRHVLVQGEHQRVWQFAFNSGSVWTDDLPPFDRSALYAEYSFVRLALARLLPIDSHFLKLPVGSRWRVPATVFPVELRQRVDPTQLDGLVEIATQQYVKLDMATQTRLRHALFGEFIVPALELYDLWKRGELIAVEDAP